MNDRSERDRLVEAHHYLCARAARKFMRGGLDRRDLEQTAAIGLIKAADRFDPQVGTPFEAFAWTYILGELMHHVRDAERLLRAPRRLRDLARRWSAAHADLAQRCGAEPSDREIAEALDLTPGECREIGRYRESERVLSVDAIGVREHADLSYTLDVTIDRMAIAHAVARLSMLERTLVCEIYENDVPICEVASKLGYSRRHVTRMHRAVLKKLAAFACHRAG
ncbi:MAG: sigma-70 family RNA polymerase sigma factor [bacterium]|nr:sigma-70 family RNA polymerase sigma factor [bacterium]